MNTLRISEDEKKGNIMDILTVEILIVSAMIVIAVTELLKLVVIEIIEDIILYKRRKRRRWK